MRHPFHIRVYVRPDFQVFSSGLGYSEYRKAAYSYCDLESAAMFAA